MSELDTGAAETAAESVVVPEVTMDQTMEKVFERLEGGNGADRGQDGKFASKDATAGATTGDASTTTTETADTSTTQAPGAVTPTEAPKSWSDADKAVFAKAPPEVQKVILARETERDTGVNRKLEEIATERKRYESLNPVLAPIEAEARKFNMNAGTAVKQMFDRHVDLQTRGVAALKDLAKLYGISTDGLDGGSDVGAVDPEIAALKAQNATLSKRLDHYEQGQQQASRTAQEREIDNVRDEKDKAGVAVRPHFEALYDDMAPIVQTLRIKNPSWSPTKLMTEAYDRAIYANPEIRAKVESANAVKAKAEAEAKAKEDAKIARKGLNNVTRTTGAHTGAATKGKTMDDTMARVYEESNAA